MRLEYFQLIDAVEDLAAADGRIRCRAQVPETSTVFEGHFPGYPIMPGVLLVESMAQSSGYLLLARADFARMPFLVAVDAARLRSFVPPGAALQVHATLEHDGSGYAVTKARIERDGKLVADAQLKFRTLPYPSPEFETLMRAQARKVGLAA